MTEKETLEAINKTIIGLEEHFIVEECEKDYTPFCMSCLAIRVSQDLKALAEALVD